MTACFMAGVAVGVGCTALAVVFGAISACCSRRSDRHWECVRQHLFSHDGGER